MRGVEQGRFFQVFSASGTEGTGAHREEFEAIGANRTVRGAESTNDNRASQGKTGSKKQCLADTQAEASVILGLPLPEILKMSYEWMTIVLNAHRRLEARRATLIGENINSNSVAMWAKDAQQQRVDFIDTLNGELEAGIEDGESDS